MIKSWAKFDRKLRYSDDALLAGLSEFRDPVLIAGCQRSGTTAVTRLLRETEEFESFAFTDDDELDAALILSKELPLYTERRTVFQTTYVNNHFQEYYDHSNFRLLWILRNPEAVVYSMLNNWRRSALNRLFRACGANQLDPDETTTYRRWGHWSFSRLDMACHCFNEKSRHATELAANLPPNQLMFLDYDSLVSAPRLWVKKICEFIEIPFVEDMASSLSNSSIGKSNALNKRHRNRVRALCGESFDQTLALCSPTNGN